MKDGESPQVRELFALVAHDLHSPVAALLLQLGSLRSLAEAETIDRTMLAMKIDKALLATERLSGLLDGVLEVSRIEKQAPESSPIETDLADVVAEVYPKLVQHARSGDCRLDLELDNAPGLWNHRRLEQVISLLLSHAIRIGRGGTVEIATTGGENEVILRIAVRSRRARNSPGEQLSDALELSLAVRIARSLGGDLVTRSSDEARVYEVRLPR